MHARSDAASDPESSSTSPVEPLPPETTVELLQMARAGDADALNRLLARCLPALRRWAHGRLPPSARDIRDTADLVQDAVLAAMRRLEAFEPRHQGALQAYLREAIMNRIRDVLRQQRRRPLPVQVSDSLKDEATSPLEAAIGAEKMARYEAALQRLKPADREAIIGRVEMQYGYDELAVVLGKPSGNAARVAVTRAIKRLAAEIARVS
jgi:RNA polymerase sigma-70 factor (ECF subfamily)